jgi:hypothetical protein
MSLLFRVPATGPGSEPPIWPAWLTFWALVGFLVVRVLVAR